MTNLPKDGRSCGQPRPTSNLNWRALAGINSVDVCGCHSFHLTKFRQKLTHQWMLRRVIEKNYHLHRSSRDAYRSYMHAYAAHSHKDCFDVHKLDLSKVAKAFGFAHPPKVELNLKHTARKKATGTKGTLKKQLSGQSSGHQFSADNPYGQRDVNDKRQFSR